MQACGESAVTSKVELAAAIARRTAAVAAPDSRFGRDFTQFIPSFEGAQQAAERAMATPECCAARLAFVTPDNAVAEVRRLFLQRGVDIIAPSYGLRRGFVRMAAKDVPASAAPFAGWLDALEHFGRSLSLQELKGVGAIDVVVTGAAAITETGLRFGMGDFYLDIEWAILSRLGLVEARTPVVAVVHDVQITDEDLPPAAPTVAADVIATPSRLLRPPPRPRPGDLDWSIAPEALKRTATLQDFSRLPLAAHL